MSEVPPFTVKRFEFPEKKRYINSINYYIIIIIIIIIMMWRSRSQEELATQCVAEGFEGFLKYRKINK